VCVYLSTFAACSDGKDDASTAAVENLYVALAEWDTARIQELTCEDERATVESALRLGSNIFGIGSGQGFGVQGELRDMTFTQVEAQDDQAQIAVSGRILYGAPLGSIAVDDLVTVHRNGGVWCVKGSVGDNTATPSATQPNQSSGSASAKGTLTSAACDDDQVTIVLDGASKLVGPMDCSKMPEESDLRAVVGQDVELFFTCSRAGSCSDEDFLEVKPTDGSEGILFRVPELELSFDNP
jgi:hypothetical protein